MTSGTLRVEENSTDDGIRLLIPRTIQAERNLNFFVHGRTFLSLLPHCNSSGYEHRYNVKLATLTVTDHKDRGLPAGRPLAQCIIYFEQLQLFYSGTMTANDVLEMSEVIRNLGFTRAPRSQMRHNTLLSDAHRKDLGAEGGGLVEVGTHFMALDNKRVAALQPAVNKAVGNLLKEEQLEASEHRFAKVLTFLRAKGQSAVADYLTEDYLVLFARSKNSDIQYKAVGNLLKEEQLEASEHRFAKVLTFLRAKGQSAVADYLTEDYLHIDVKGLGKTESWASSVNKGTVMDTIMISKRSHRMIKDGVLYRNANCRLDCLMGSLI
ncbi:hypothetical protein COOONC_10192 [Cooperia oncophora]